MVRFSFAMNRVALGIKLRLLRIGVGYSETELAKECKMARQIIVRTEKGQQLPSLDTLDKWVTACGTTLSRFFEELHLEERRDGPPIVPGFEEYYQYLTKVIRSGEPQYIHGIFAVLRGLSMAAAIDAELRHT